MPSGRYISLEGTSVKRATERTLGLDQTNPNDNKTALKYFLRFYLLITQSK